MGRPTESVLFTKVHIDPEPVFIYARHLASERSKSLRDQVLPTWVAGAWFGEEETGVRLIPAFCRCAPRYVGRLDRQERRVKDKLVSNITS